jgi:hypothetical protein
MADFKLTEEQEKQICRESIQQSFLFKLDYDPKSKIALVGVPKKETAGIISCTEVVEGLKKLGVPAHSTGELSDGGFKNEYADGLKKGAKMYDALQLPGSRSLTELTNMAADGINQSNKDYDIGVRVVPEPVVLKVIPKAMALDASELEKTFSEGAAIIMVSPKECRHFVEATHVDFAGKSVVLPDIVMEEKVRSEKVTESETKAVLDRRVRDEAFGVAIDASTKKFFGGLQGRVTIEGEAEHERNLIEAVKRDVKSNGAKVLDDPALHLSDPIKAKVKAELEEDNSLGSIRPSVTPKQQQPQQQQPQKPGASR